MSVESKPHRELELGDAPDTMAGALATGTGGLEIQRVWRHDAVDGVGTTAVRSAVQQLRAGGLVVLHDDQNDQGDLIAAGRLTTPGVVNTMVRHGGGLVCVALTPERARELGLRPLPVRAGGRQSCERTPAMVSVEARSGVSTGISTADRARTITLLADPMTGAHELVSPGHVLPLVAAEGGLLERYGRLQAAVDVVRFAGLDPAAALCDVLDDAGDLAGSNRLAMVARRLGIPFVSISELAEARSDDVWSRC